MRKKTMTKWIAMCLCSVMLAGCGGTGIQDEGHAVSQIAEDNSQETSQEHQPSLDNPSTPADKEDSREGGLTPVELSGRYERAAYLTDMAYEKSGSANTMVSPLSLDMALGLVSGGAKGQTREELLTYLGTEDYGVFAEQYMEYAEGLNINPASSLLHTYYESDYKMAYEIANSIWVKDDRKLVESYAKLARKQYDAEIASVSFEKANIAKTVAQINDWCNEKTHELIPQIIREDSITDETAAILINSLYFESPWSEKWGLTTHSFTDFDGNSTEQEMLCDSLTTYYENDYATAFAKGYQNGMKFIGILPKETGEFTLSDLDTESLLESETTEYDVNALMPKLDFDTTADGIVEILKAQGVETVFDKGQSDLSGLIEMEADEITYISDIIQKTKIELDENGTKAAAVTAIMMNCTSALQPVQREVKQVYLDRPFAFVIYDEENEQIVFMGKVVTP